MHLPLKITVRLDRDILPTARELAEAGGDGVANAVKRHLVDRDRRAVAKDGMPRTGYYGDAASDVTTEMAGDIALVTIHKEGFALHYYGGVVYPTSGHKALAIPKSPSTAGKRPAEYDPDRSKLALVWPKGETTGTLRDKESGDIVYLLVAKATMPADPSVLPSRGELETAAANAMELII